MVAALQPSPLQRHSLCAVTAQVLLLCSLFIVQKTLNQPVAAVKEMLFQMADQIKRGPNKDLWELKPAMKAALAAQAKQAAAAAAAGGGS